MRLLPVSDHHHFWPAFQEFSSDSKNSKVSLDYISRAIFLTGIWPRWVFGSFSGTVLANAKISTLLGEYTTLLLNEFSTARNAGSGFAKRISAERPQSQGAPRATTSWFVFFCTQYITIAHGCYRWAVLAMMCYNNGSSFRSIMNGQREVHLVS